MFVHRLVALRVIFRHARRHEAGTQGLGFTLVPRSYRRKRFDFAFFFSSTDVNKEI